VSTVVVSGWGLYFACCGLYLLFYRCDCIFEDIYASDW